MTDLSNVNIHFGGADDEVLISQELELESTSLDRISRYAISPGDSLRFWSFQGSLTNEPSGEARDYLALSMSIPRMLADGNSSDPKYKYAGLFLVDALMKEKKPISGDFGIYDCPIPIRVGTALGKYSDKKASISDECFYFGRNYFYPLLLPNWGTLFYVTESSKPFLQINDPDPELAGTVHQYNFSSEHHVLSGSDRIQYDTILGIYYCRNVDILNVKSKEVVNNQRR